MNIKPAPEQVDDWELKAAQYADSQTGEYFYEYQLAKNEKFAELAAKWGAEQAQQGQLTVIDPDAWEPCTPSYLRRGGSCHAPRVWDAATCNHWHPKLVAKAQQTTSQRFALVPLVPTRAMEYVMEQEDWEWAELLAAANAVTEEQYEAAQAQQTTEPELPEPEAMGYKTEMLSLSAADLGGDHQMERFWLLAYANDKGQLRSTVNAKVAECAEFRGSIWQTKPDYSRVDDGMAGRMERYKATGNGQVPIVAAAALWSLANA